MYVLLSRLNSWPLRCSVGSLAAVDVLGGDNVLVDDTDERGDVAAKGQRVAVDVLVEADLADHQAGLAAVFIDDTVELLLLQSFSGSP